MSPTANFDTLIHAPNRLQICSLLSATGEVEFSILRESIDVSDSVLSKHLKVLEDDGVIKVRKASVKSRPTTWASLTKAGRQRFENHVAELRQLVADAGL